MTLPKHLPALDGLRGVAVILVIASHTFPMIPALPWTIKRFSNLGFYGVQLFFVVSCFTLANSWRRTEASGTLSLKAFALRRIFRIAPAYYLAAIGYLWLIDHESIGPVRVVTFLTVTNGWTPALMPTIPGAWIGVPGGWSIEAEFAFYALFPILMVTLRGLTRSFACLLLSLPLAWLANSAGRATFAPIYGAASTDQFLFYWVPNQLPVFLCGLVAYEVACLVVSDNRFTTTRRHIAANCHRLLGMTIFFFLLLAFTSWPRLPQPDHAFVPAHLLATIAFCVTLVVLVVRPTAIMANRVVIMLGKASFSAYLVHFAVISGLEHVLPHWVLDQVQAPAVVTSFLLFLLVMIVTGGISQLTYHAIELPAIKLGGWLIRVSQRRVVPISLPVP